jgi:hypothetical protein
MSDLCKPDLLEAWIYETASSEDAREMEQHILGCRSCSDEAAWLRRERRMFDSRARATTTDHAALWAKVAPQLKGGTVTPLRSRSATMFGGLVAAAAAVLCMVKLGESFMGHGNAVTGSLSSTPGAALPEHAQPATEKHTDQRWAFTVAAHPQVMIDNPNGNITVVAGTTGAIKMHAVIDEDAKSAWRVDTKQDKGVIMTRVSCQGLDCGDAPDVELTAEVPEDCELTMHAVAADLTVHQVHGRVVANTVDGDIELNSMGQVQAKSVSGDITLLGGASVASKLESVSGDLAWKGKCGQGCELELVTVSGDIQLAHSEDSSFRMRFQTVSGEAPTLVSTDDSDHLPGRPRIITVNGGKGTISVKTVSGDFDYGNENTQFKVGEDADGDLSDARKGVAEAHKILAEAHTLIGGSLNDKLVRDATKRGLDQAQTGLEQAKHALDAAKKELDQARSKDNLKSLHEGMQHELDESKKALDEAKKAIDEERRELEAAHAPVAPKK